MPIASDFDIDSSGNITVTGTPASNYTVLELHRWLQSLADDASFSGDDQLDITDVDPSTRSTDNIITLNAPFNIDDTAAQYLYNGSITQAGGDTIYAGLTVVGSVVTGTELQVVQNNAVLTSHWSTGKNTDAGNNILNRVLIKVRANGTDIDGRRVRVFAREYSDSYAEFSLTMGLGNNVAAIFTSDDPFNTTASGTVSGYYGSTVTNTEGYQSYDLTTTASTEPYYSKWTTTGAENLIYETTKYITRRGSSTTLYGLNGALLRGITHSFAYDGESGGSPAVGDEYAWGTYMTYSSASGNFTVGESVTFSTSNAKGRILADDDNGTSGHLVIDIQSGTPVNGQTITGASSGTTATVAGVVLESLSGTGTILAVNDAGTTGTIQMQLTRGVVPTDNDVLYKGTVQTQFLLVNGSITSRTVAPHLVGTSTGTGIIGAFGIGYEPTDTTSADVFTDLNGVTASPPNLVNITVSGLVQLAGDDDYVFVARSTGTGSVTIDTAVMNVATALTTNNPATLVVDAIPSDTPASGTIRIIDDVGKHRRVAYSAHNGTTTFTLTSAGDFTAPNDASIGNDVYATFLDQVSTAASHTAQVQYSTNRDLVVRVRNGDATDPIKPFETAAVLTSSGVTVNAIRTSDE